MASSKYNIAEYKRQYKKAEAELNKLRKKYEAEFEGWKAPSKTAAKAIEKVVVQMQECTELAPKEKTYIAHQQIAATLYYALGDAESAMEHFEIALKGAPKSRRGALLQHMTYVADDAGQRERGLECAKALTRVRAKDPYAWTAYALALTMSRKFDEAITLLERKEKMDPGLMYARLYYVRGVKNGKFKRPKTYDDMFEDIDWIFNTGG